MVAQYLPRLCVSSTIGQTDTVRLDCLDVRSRAVTHTIVSSEAEGVATILSTFSWLVGLAMIGLLTWDLALRGLERIRGRMKGHRKMEVVGNHGGSYEVE